MPVASSVFLVLSLALAILLGPQTRPWTWGPSITALAIAALAAVPSFWRGRRFAGDFGLMGLGLLTAGWITWRACVSPVREFAEADGILLAVAVTAFFATRAIVRDNKAGGILIWGLALVMAGNLLVAAKELADPAFSPLIPKVTVGDAVTGFFTHYNEAANFFVAASMLLAGAGLFGGFSRGSKAAFLLLAAAGLAAVFFTGSRGGILAAAVGCGVLAATGLLLGRKREAKWFGPAIVAVPIVAILLIGGLYFAWMAAQDRRFEGSGIDGLLDNTSRLYFLGIVLACIGQHPAMGGGSRSFSWECFRFVEGTSEGDIITRRPEFVHNEILQSATDYGIIGLALIVALLATLVIGGVVRAAFAQADSGETDVDFWRVGGLAALIGMLVQSCFSFVFHLLPGVILLGTCLGMTSLARRRPRDPGTTGVAAVGTMASIGGAVVLLFFGGKGILVSRHVWQSYFGDPAETTTDSRLDALGAGLRIWPRTEFHLERAEIFHESAGNPNDAGFTGNAERAIEEYQKAARLNPYDPGFVVNQANLLSLLERDEEAERKYIEAVSLQGGMEPGFRVHYSTANHFLRKALREFRAGSIDTALDAIERSASELETAVDQMHWTNPEMRSTRIDIHENLGTIREAAHDREGAMEAYNFASELPGGRRVHYRAAVLLGRQAVDAWSDRKSSRALALFIQARHRVRLAKRELPAGISADQHDEYLDYLNRTIRFLEGAKIRPGR